MEEHRIEETKALPEIVFLGIFPCIETSSNRHRLSEEGTFARVSDRSSRV